MGDNRGKKIAQSVFKTSSYLPRFSQTDFAERWPFGLRCPTVTPIKKEKEVIYRASIRLKFLFKFKDSITSYHTSGIVHKYMCCRCNSTYVSESIGHAKKRYSEHLGISTLAGKPLNGQN